MSATPKPVIGPLFTDQYPRIEAVLDQAPAGMTEPGFDRTTVSVTVDGNAVTTPVEIKRFSDTRRGMAIVIAVDVSGSMSGAPLDALRAALKTFVESTSADDRIGLITIADDVRVDSGFDQRRDQLLGAISGLQTRGKITELYKGVVRSMELLSSGDLPLRRRIIVISDGKDEGTAYKLDEDVLKQANGMHLPVDAVGLSHIDPKYLSIMERLADNTAGGYARASDPNDLSVIFKNYLERYQRTPVLSFEVAQPADGARHQLFVSIKSGNDVLTADREATWPPATPAEQSSSASAMLLKRLAKPVWLVPVLVIGMLVLLGGLIFTFTRKKPALPVVQPARPTKIEPAPAPVAAPARAVAPQAAPAKPRVTQYGATLAAPRVGAPCLKLRFEIGTLAGRTIPMETEVLWLGAEDGNTVVISGDSFMSGQHACLKFNAGSVLIYDNHSTNGTFVNGERLADLPRPLGSGDRVKLGKNEFVVMI